MSERILTDFEKIKQLEVEVARLTAENKVLSKQLTKSQADNMAITLALIDKER